MSELVKVSKHLFLISLFFLFACVNSYSQDYSLDSIKKVLETEMHDTTRLRTISVILENENQRDSISIYYNKQVIAILAKNLHSKELDYRLRDKYLYYLAYWYADQAVVLASKESSPEIITYLDKSAAIFKYLHMPDEAWTTINNKGNALRKMAEYEIAIACFFDALKYHELKANKLGIAAANSSIGAVYLDQNKFTQAIVFYNKALTYYDSIKQPENKDLYEKAIIAYNIGVCYYLLENYNSAEIYLLKALAIEKENNFLDNISFVYDRLANIAIKESKLDKAFEFYKEGLIYAKKERAKAMLMNSLGEFYVLKKDYTQAINHFNKALNHTNAAKDLEILESIYLNLYNSYKVTHQFDKSLQMFELYTDLKKSNREESSKNALAQQQLKYDYEKKEFQTKLEQEKKLSNIKLENERKHTHKNIIMYLLISLAVILCVSIFYLFKFFKQKNIINANKNNELKQKLMLTQMNPHFIFNSVDNIQSLIHNKQDKEAISYLTKFSKLTRQILENSTENYITLSEELAMTDNYLNIQQLLYNNKFTYAITVDESIDSESILLPPMLTQPFIENAIKHGLKHKITGGVIAVKFYMKDQFLFFEVTDNGSGFETEKNSSEHKSLATQIVTERLKNNVTKRAIVITTQNIIENNTIKGVQTTFEIPYIYDN
ncbi:MAG: histidine kinase [Bacteroidota bacterium]